MKMIALCHTCALSHTIEFDPMHEKPGAEVAFSQWLTKHPRPHETEFRWPQRTRRLDAPPEGWLSYAHNADVKIAYAATVTVTITMASLAASSTWIAGRESTAIDNGATNVKYPEYHLGLKTMTGATGAQVGEFRVYFIGALNDTPAWPDNMTGSDAARTVSAAGLLQGFGSPLVIPTVASANAPYYRSAIGVAQFFGGYIPDQFSLYFTHNAQSGTNTLHATSGNHAMYLTPVYGTVL
jgi:hypothetical protein